MGKIKTLAEIVKQTRELQKQGKTIGLVTGCFDVLHLGHVGLFKFAKKHVDILIVGLENDQSVKLSKGLKRPIFTQSQRARLLAELVVVDFIFIIRTVSRFDGQKIERDYRRILKRIGPDYLFTGIPADHYWREKKQRASKLGIRFVFQKRKTLNSSSKIVKILENLDS